MIINVNGEYATFSPSDEQSIYNWGVLDERERMLKAAQDYFELTRFSIEVEGAKDNPEWDAGYQAALTFIKKEIE